MTNEIYEKLVEQYGEKACTLYDNGVVEVRKKNDSVYIPTTINTSNLFSYFPGMGGRSSDSVTPVNDVIKSSQPPNYILSISSHHYDANSSMIFATEVAKSVGYNIDNVSLTTFSASGGMGFKRLEEYLETYSDVNASMVACDEYNLEHPTNNKYFKNIDLLVEREIPIIMLGPSNSKRFKDVTDDLSSTGLNFYKLYSDRTTHIKINNDAITNGIQEYILGVRDTLNYDRENNTIDACNYQIYRYDPNNPNADEKGYVLISLDDNELLNYLGNSIYPTIKNNISFTSEGTVASDLYLVAESMKAINDSIRSNNALKTVGIIAGAGLAVGAAALGAYEYKKSKEDSDEYNEDDEEY